MVKLTFSQNLNECTEEYTHKKNLPSSNFYSMNTIFFFFSHVIYVAKIEHVLPLETNDQYAVYNSIHFHSKTKNLLEIEMLNVNNCMVKIKRRREFHFQCVHAKLLPHFTAIAIAKSYWLFK